MKAPARDPSDFCIARSAEATLFIPEKAKRTSAPKRFPHMGFFAFFEVDDRLVALALDLSALNRNLYTFTNFYRNP